MGLGKYVAPDLQVRGSTRRVPSATPDLKVRGYVDSPIPE
jgi:hypothetical protein